MEVIFGFYARLHFLRLITCISKPEVIAGIVVAGVGLTKIDNIVGRNNRP
jgi:hypothetical protein